MSLAPIRVEEEEVQPIRYEESQTNTTNRQLKPIRTKIKKELILFCQTTTIRGVTRVVNARSKSFQIVWASSVLFLFIGLFICMFFLTRQYLEYHVIHPPQVLRDTPSPFPSITLCNLRPLASEATKVLEESRIKTPRKFAMDVNSFAAEAFYHKGDVYSYQLITSAISMGGYLESLPPEIRLQLGHHMNQTIIHCMVLYSEGSKRVLNDCHQVGHWRRFVHAQYLNCYSYDLLEKFRDHVRTIELFVYLDVPPNKTSCVDCFSAEIKSQLSGAVVVVHNADTYPDINQEGINIQPGSLTEIKVKTIKHIQKTPPYGRCSPDTPKTIELYGAAPYRYSEHACRMSTIQTQINDRCGCNAIEFPYRNSSLPFCLAMGSFVHEGSCDVQKLQADGSKATNSTTIGSLKSQCLAELEVVKNHVTCKSDVTRHFEGDVVPSCTLPCQFFSYETDRSTSTWPTKSWQLGWLGTRAGRMILDRPELAPYREARDLMRQPNGDVRAQTLLSQTNVLEKNLLAIMIIRPNFNLHNVEEKEVLSLTSLLSQTGGLLSIWIGMNIMSVIELFELLVHLFGTCKQPENRKKMNEDSSHQLRAVRSEVEETEDGMHITDNLYNGNEERLSQNSIIRHPKNNSNNSTNRRLKQRRTKCLKGTCQRVRQSSTNLECSERSLP